MNISGTHPSFFYPLPTIPEDENLEIFKGKEKAGSMSFFVESKGILSAAIDFIPSNPIFSKLVHHIVFSQDFLGNPEKTMIRWMLQPFKVQALDVMDFDMKDLSRAFVVANLPSLKQVLLDPDCLSDCLEREVCSKNLDSLQCALEKLEIALQNKDQDSLLKAECHLRVLLSAFVDIPVHYEELGFEILDQVHIMYPRQESLHHCVDILIHSKEFLENPDKAIVSQMLLAKEEGVENRGIHYFCLQMSLGDVFTCDEHVLARAFVAAHLPFFKEFITNAGCVEEVFMDQDSPHECLLGFREAFKTSDVVNSLNQSKILLKKMDTRSILQAEFGFRFILKDCLLQAKERKKALSGKSHRDRVFCL